MKVLPLKTLLFSNAPLKIISLLLGYSFWHVASINQIITISATIPLYFSSTPHQVSVKTPDEVTVTLQGKRSDLYGLEKESLAAHVNISKLLPGKHGIILKGHHLFLPHTITLLQYKPSNLSCTIVDKKSL
jgi:hypothetical protein